MTRNQCSLYITKYQTTNTFHCFAPLWIFSNVWVDGIKIRLKHGNSNAYTHRNSELKMDAR